jgi:hypothetical protein
MLPTPSPTVIYRVMSDGAVLFSTADEVYFGLNAVGARVWSLLPPTCDTIESLCSELGRTYPEVAPEMLQADVAELLDELAANGLVIQRGDRNGTRPPGPPEAPSNAEPAAAEADVADAKRVG